MQDTFLSLELLTTLKPPTSVLGDFTNNGPKRFLILPQYSPFHPNIGFEVELLGLGIKDLNFNSNY